MNSLMLHGLIYARYAEHLGADPDHDFPDEVHSYFGTGTQLQEMYITPRCSRRETGMCWPRRRSGREPTHKR